MFLQGNLQTVFDALYEVGAIDPVLKMDWNQILDEMSRHPEQAVKAFTTVNAYSGSKDKLIAKLNEFDTKSIQFIAMEVAREFCEFQDRKNLH